MLLLLAVLLAFLAQNLLTPSPFDFLGVCACLMALGAILISQSRERALELNTTQVSYLALLLISLVIAWQFFPPLLAAGLCMLIAGGLFVYELTRTRTRDQDQARAPISARTQALVIVLVLLASLVLSVYNNDHIQPGLHGDEAESGIEARNIDAGRYDSLIGVGWYDQPLLSFFVQAIGLRIFGDTISGLRTTSAVVSLLTLPLVYLLARKLFDDRVALITLVLMAFAHWFIAYARLGINYNQTTLLEVLAVLFFWQGWQTQQRRWFVLSGIVTGAGLYLYFASRLVPILLIAFTGYVWWLNSKSQPREDVATQSPTSNLQQSHRGALAQLPISISHIALWLATMMLIFLPMGLFFIEHAKEFSSRASFVFLFSDTQYDSAAQKMKQYTGSTDIATALAVQVYRYATLFNMGGAHDGQYGNSLSLLEYYTAVFCALGLAYALYHGRQPRFMLLLLWLVLTIFVGGVLTIESPFTPRLVGLMPVPFMLAAVALDQLWTRLNFRFQNSSFRFKFMRWVPHAIAALLVAAIVYSNYYSYFEHYIHSIDGWAQREPATVIANYAAQLQSDQTMYVLSAPELYVWHGTIRFIAPNLRGYDLLEPEDDLPTRDPNTRRASFVMLPPHTTWLTRLKELYPHGDVKEWRRPWGELWFIIYEVPAEDIAAARK